MSFQDLVFLVKVSGTTPTCRLSGFRSSLQPEPIYLRPKAAVRAAEAAASGGARKETTSVWVISSREMLIHRFTGVK